MRNGGKKSWLLPSGMARITCGFLAQPHGARRVPESDVDFLVEFKPGYGLIDRIALIQDLQDLLGCNVDVVRERSLRERIRANVMKDVVRL